MYQGIQICRRHVRISLQVIEAQSVILHIQQIPGPAVVRREPQLAEDARTPRAGGDDEIDQRGPGLGGERRLVLVDGWGGG
jgi:hypothetical protein